MRRVASWNLGAQRMASLERYRAVTECKKNIQRWHENSRLARSVKRSLTHCDKLRLSLHRASNHLIIQKDSFRIISQVEFNPKDLPLLRINTKRFKQILINLLSNAVKFTPNGGHINLQVIPEAEHGVIRFIVQDNGIGIAAEDMAKLFKPFTQIDSRLSRDYEGTGLGLALVQRLVDLQGGSVSVESEGLGQGSRFTVALPWQPINKLPAAAGRQAETSALPPPAPNLTVLVVEDNEANIEPLQDYLTFRGYGVVVAKDGVQGIMLAMETNPALILMDIEMPVMDGLQAMQRLRGDPRFAKTPIIALIARAMQGDRERCLEAGASAYLSKPASLNKLSELMALWLGKCHVGAGYTNRSIFKY
jgi:CheY-like chemotaxis protein